MNGEARKIDFEVDANGCYICISHKANKDGYRQIVIRGSLIIMHRFIYQQCFGDIPTGMIVRHKCDNTHCINPEHLEKGTPLDNVKDRVERGRGKTPTGEKNGQSKLKAPQVREIYKRIESGEFLKDIAADYQVGTTTIFKIKKGLTWKDLKIKYESEKAGIRG